MNEAHILKSNNILLVLSKLEDESLIKDFCGTVVEFCSDLPSVVGKTLYLCGDLSKASEIELEAAEKVFVIKELSYGDETTSWIQVDLGQVPILVHDVGVFYRRYFDPNLDYFQRICDEHVFQSLTESTKPGTAHRTGIYLTPVKKVGEDLHFRLLRCSTNLSGSTENFRSTDLHIVDALNQEADRIFEQHHPLNHILAQVYNNTIATSEQKQKKAKIKAHADKTKDMPKNGIMAFCTFYDQLDKLHSLTNDHFDYGINGTSGMTKLHFRLKNASAEGTLPAQFTITLYPGSVFFMPLSTNRLYTHEIRSSMLDAEKLPTRLGYVVRCSNAEAIHKEKQTFLKLDGKHIPLLPPTPEGMVKLRNYYAEENKSESYINYGDQFLFSMNQGDYFAPEYKLEDEFRIYHLPIKDNLFAELEASARFENVGKGRQGTVLVNPNVIRGIPIVRTTSRYSSPAQCFRTIHTHLAQQIQKNASASVDFNNALIEIYANSYATMGFHSDQSIDLQEGTYIALFSCYESDEFEDPPRKLVVEAKEASSTVAGRDTFEIPLPHNSVVLFSTDTNRRFKHKIVLDTSTAPAENQWLGITFRTSKTFVQFSEGQACLENSTPLILATEEQRQEFYSLRRRENQEADFKYPGIGYTLSESDLMSPESS